MTPILVDSNVLLDVATLDPRWSPWSAAALRDAADAGATLVINPIVFAEVSVGFGTFEEVDRALPSGLYRRDPLPYDAAHLAGKAFLEYRRRGGGKAAPLPDFYIGAHATSAGYRLLTRDAARYRTYFPAVNLICPI